MDKPSNPPAKPVILIGTGDGAPAIQGTFTSNGKTIKTSNAGPKIGK